MDTRVLLVSERVEQSERGCGKLGRPEIIVERCSERIEWFSDVAMAFELQWIRRRGAARKRWALSASP